MAAAERSGNGGIALFPKWHSARRDIHAACRRAGIAPCSWNDLRRTNATLLNHAGMTSADIGHLLGHVDGRMVETVYGQSTPQSLQRALDAAFEDSTVTAQLEARPLALPAKKAESAPLKEGLRSRRSEVRILCGAREKLKSSGETHEEASTKSAEVAGVPYTSSTAHHVPVARNQSPIPLGLGEDLPGSKSSAGGTAYGPGALPQKAEDAGGNGPAGGVVRCDLKPDKWDLLAAFAEVIGRHHLRRDRPYDGGADVVERLELEAKRWVPVEEGEL